MSELNLPALLTSAINIVETAGALLKTEWLRAGGPRGNGNTATIDHEIERFLRKELLALLYCDYWGEETGHDLTGNSMCWVVDPNDGTADFLRGLKGSAISVGLLRKQIPVLGIVHAPVTDTGRSDCIAWCEGLPSVLRNGVAVQVRLQNRPLTEEDHVMVSAAAVRKQALNSLLCDPAQFIPMPSIAYRLARVAAGDGVCAISLYPVSAHDVVAGHAMLLGAGGTLVDESGRVISYKTCSEMATVSQYCFGGSYAATKSLHSREWFRLKD